MGNILNHNRDVFRFDLVKEDYWDFQLCIDNSGVGYNDDSSEKCLSVNVDLTDNDCIWFDEIYSKDGVVWEKAINTNTLVLDTFGFTSVDNGKTKYEKDKISNKDFLTLYMNTKFFPKENDTRFTMTKVDGNQQIYSYDNDVTLWNDEIQCAKLNGGWYQGFFCANDGSEYKVLPTSLGDGWSFEFELNKEDFANEKQTMNDSYPENKGIFFYIGTRAENKWWLKYLTKHDFEWCSKSTFADGYTEDDGYIEDIQNILNADYFKHLDNPYEDDGYVGDRYVAERYMDTDKYTENEYLVSQEFSYESSFDNSYIDKNTEDNCEVLTYVEDGYYEEETKIDENMKLKTKNGHEFYQPNIKEIKTDNKFLIFDRTPNGVTVKNWEEGTEILLSYIKKPNIGNYFTKLHHGKGGYEVCDIKEEVDIYNKEYNVLTDLYRNALAFQIKDDGTLGYKYLVKDCESDTENYKIETEFTKTPVVENGKWQRINVNIKPVKSGSTMKIEFWVDGRLVMVSKTLSEIRLRKLDDLDEKQEGVPFNISLGGGTQGLSEVVYLNYMRLPEYVLPLEKEFGGSFIGWVKNFKFYTCPLNYNKIRRN